MNRTRTRRSAASRDAVTQGKGFVVGFHGVRYQVRHVSRAVEFYTKSLGFTLGHQQLPAFANVSIENLTMLLSGPEASGSRPMPDGRRQEPGGWNRVVLKVADLPARIEALKTAGLRFRNETEVGPAGRQIQLEDPDGNAISCSNQRDNAYSRNQDSRDFHRWSGFRSGFERHAACLQWRANRVVAPDHGKTPHKRYEIGIAVIGSSRAY